MIYVSTVWRLSADRPLEGAPIVAALKGFDNLVRVSAEQDRGGDLFVSVIARSTDARGALQAMRSALALATESMGPVTVSNDWAGVFEGEVDAERLAALPPGPPQGWRLRRLRQQLLLNDQSASSSDVPEVWFDVEARISRISPVEAMQPLAVELLPNMRAMNRIDRPSVDIAGEALVLRFGLRGADEEEAQVAALNATEELVSASIPDSETECRIDVVKVSSR